MNSKQQTAVEWFIEELEYKGYLRETPSIRNIQLNIDTSDYMELKVQSKEMEVAGKEMSYADGYAEGYKRALELTQWAISNLIPPHNEHIVDANKMIEEGEQAIIDYNKMEEESEMDNYNEMKEESEMDDYNNLGND
jgi:hypothetical protein